MRLILLCTALSSYSLLLAGWVQKADFGGVGRHRAVGITIGNKGYLGLGHVNGTGIDISYKDWWQFDPASNSWTQRANYPVNNHGAIGFGMDTKGYIGGGSALNGEFYEYNPQTNLWTPIAPCPISPGDNQGFAIQGKGYVYFTNLLYEYDPSTNSWSQKANLPVSVGSWCSAFANYSSGFVKYLHQLYEYKPSSNTWVQRAYFPGLFSNGGSAFSLDERGFFVCGYIGALSDVTNEVWRFDPGSNTWTMVEEFPGTSRRFPVAFAINGIGYFGTGTNGINMNDFWSYEYNPLGIEELNGQEISFSSYPQPASDQATITPVNDILMNNDYSLELYSAEGRYAGTHKPEENSFRVSAENLNSGIYYFRIIYKEQTIFTDKLIFSR